MLRLWRSSVNLSWMRDKRGCVSSDEVQWQGGGASAVSDQRNYSDRLPLRPLPTRAAGFSREERFSNATDRKDLSPPRRPRRRRPRSETGSAQNFVAGLTDSISVAVVRLTAARRPPG